ncbi:MAG: hypothetical protein HRT89_17040, partial [Lentisphaeria bacterium]|nr:hypothetical protein [Lentisphaeria bacterium]
MHLADVLKEQGNYKDARANFEKYLVIKPGDKEAMEGAESCRKAISWVSDPTRHIVMAEIQLNTDHYDFAPAWGDKKHNMLIFSSSREGSTGEEIDQRTGEGFMDLWITTRDQKGKWGEPVILPTTINTEDNEGGSELNSKGTKLYFTRCPRAKKENVGCDIYVADKQGKNWKQSVLI